MFDLGEPRDMVVKFNEFRLGSEAYFLTIERSTQHEHCIYKDVSSGRDCAPYNFG